MIRQILTSPHPPWVKITLLDTYCDRGLIAKFLHCCWTVVKAAIRVPHADIVHVHTAAQTSFIRKSLIVAIARAFRKKIVLHVHASQFHWFIESSRPIQILCRFTFTTADAVVLLSNYHAAALSKKYPDARTYVLPNCCDLENVCARTERGQRLPVVLFAGYIGSRKGAFDLIAAFAEVVMKIPNARLVMMGNGELERAKRLSASLSMSARIEFPGWVQGREKEKEFQRASVFCLPSHAEGVPMSVLEAMARGVPVVTTPVGGIPELIRQNETGLLVQPGDPHILADSLLRILRDEQLADRLAKAALESIQRDRTAQAYCARVVRLYGAVSDGQL